MHWKIGARKMKTLLGFLALCSIVALIGCDRGGGTAAFDPANIKSVVMYDIDPTQVQNYSEQLSKLSSYALKPEEFQVLFANMKEEAQPVRKAALLGVVQFQDGKETHLAMSTFGGFVRVLQTGKDMRFYDTSRIEYEKIKVAAMRTVFMPERQRRNPGNTK